MTNNEQQREGQANEGEAPREAPKGRDMLKALMKLAKMFGSEGKMAKVLKEGDRTAGGQESPTLVEVDPREIPFKEGSMVGLSKVDPHTNRVREKMSDYGRLDQDIVINESLSLDEGTGHTSPVIRCFMDQYGNSYVQTNNSLYRIDQVRAEEGSEEPKPLPYLRIDPTLPDTPMPTISEVIQRNAEKNQRENGGDTPPTE